jgi:Coenzyme PQQ synthesis protein D (PqqD)
MPDSGITPTIFVNSKSSLTHTGGRVMITITPNTRSIADHDGAVILDVSHNTIVTLDAMGAYIWQRLERGLQIEPIIAEIAHDTGADETMIAKDVDVFMQHLKSISLIEAVAIPASGV